MFSDKSIRWRALFFSSTCKIADLVTEVQVHHKRYASQAASSTPATYLPEQLANLHPEAVGR
jgi:hypothetical protein